MALDGHYDNIATAFPHVQVAKILQQNQYILWPSQIPCCGDYNDYHVRRFSNKSRLSQFLFHVVSELSIGIRYIDFLCRSLH